MLSDIQIKILSFVPYSWWTKEQNVHLWTLRRKVQYVQASDTFFILSLRVSNLLLFWNRRCNQFNPISLFIFGNPGHFLLTKVIFFKIKMLTDFSLFPIPNLYFDRLVKLLPNLALANCTSRTCISAIILLSNFVRMPLIYYFYLLVYVVNKKNFISVIQCMWCSAITLLSMQGFQYL